MTGPYPKISLCMIVKDEEDWIGKCLLSVRSVVYEMIVVDTGSSDKTVEIATELGAKVYSYTWENDFASARNFSISKASGDWILVLDADEAIAEEDLEELQRLTLDDSKCYEFLQRHYSNDHRLSLFKPVAGEYPEMEQGHGGYFESNLVRLFPNYPGLLYKGKVHELVEHAIKEVGAHQILRTRIPIHHYGHTEIVRQKKNKSDLYEPLGEAKLGEFQDEFQPYFEMGVQYNHSGRLEQSVTAFLTSISLNPKYVPSWVNMGYVLCELGRYEDAIVSLKTALELDRNCDEAYCNLGVVFLRTKDYKKAELCFIRAIEITPSYVNAFCNLGKTYVYMGRLAEAVHIYLQAIRLLPQCTSAKADLGAIYLAAGISRRAEKFLVEALKDDPAMSRAYYHLGQTYKKMNEAAKAVTALEKFCELEDKASLDNELGQAVRQAKKDCEALRGKAI